MSEDEELYDVWRIVCDGQVKNARIYVRLPKFEAEVRAKILNNCYAFNDNECKTLGGKHVWFKLCYATVEPHVK